MKIGTATIASSTLQLTGASAGTHSSGLDGAIAATVPTGGSFAYVGPLFGPGSIEAMRIAETAPAGLPDVIGFMPEAPLAVVALFVRDGTATRLYLPADPGPSSNRWVDVPRMPEFYAMVTSDRDAQRKAWIDALGKVKPANWPTGINLSKTNLASMSAPALRILLARLASHVCPVTAVNQPAKSFRGGQTHGFTLPLLRYPVSEPDCYIRVIAGREGRLESINAYDLSAGISLGSIQFNVHRAAIFRFLHAFHRSDPALFGACFNSFGWSPKMVTIGGQQVFAMDVNASGSTVQLTGRDADHARNCGYFQSGVPGHDAFSQIDAVFRRSIAEGCRDAVVWPHVQESIMGISGQWLRPGLDKIQAAGIPAVNTLRPDRDTFILKALLLSAYVRFSACLDPLLNALNPFASMSAKLGAINGVLLAPGTWPNCNHDRRASLATRLAAQKVDALAAWDVIQRLADAQGAPMSDAMAVSAHPADLDEDGCEHDAHPATSEDVRLWNAQAAAAVTRLGDGGARFQALVTEAAVPRPRRRKGKAAATAAARAGDKPERIAPGDLVADVSRKGRPAIALVEAVDGRHIHVRDAAGSYRRWRGKDAAGRVPKSLRVLARDGKLTRALADFADELVFADPTLAVPPFTDDEQRVVLEPLLPQAANDAALAWNQQRHPNVSGVSLPRIDATLAAYVDPGSVKAAIAAARGAAAATADAVLVEAIHQFQRKTYVESSQHDGRCGEATLDNLGLYLGRPGLNQVDVANPTAQAHLTNINSKLAGKADNPPAPATLNASNWFRHMTAPAFLGQTFSNGIHAVLLRRFRTAERHLLSLPEYRGLTPVKLGAAVGIREFHRGSRPTATTGSMHTFGLATDINYAGNPWLKGGRIVQVLQRARRLISGAALGNAANAAAMLHAQLAGKPTAEIYDRLWTLDRDFRSYLALRNDNEELKQLLENHRQKGTAGIFDAGETVDAAAVRWRNTIVSDIDALGADDGFVGRDPRDGFLDLAKDLVIALRDVGCLAWGASDFGPTASGDIMHFDCRNTGLGRVINKGFVPPERTCA
ncbi:MAG: hypothetical protein QOF14_5776 [Hyphomicrobiales bacterium]|nr:hypothetical protein [Hyphomicrobiales bacterium]